MKFDVDDRVYYVSGRFGKTSANPCKGSVYECKGTVVYNDGFSLRVKWDNGCVNGYLNDDLELATNLDKNDPNILWPGRRKLI